GHTLTEIATYLALSQKKGNLILESIKGKSKSSSIKGEFATSDMAADSLIKDVSTWYVYKIGEDIAVHIRSGVSAWRIRKIINLLKNIKEE
ncbi:MAG: hypothetical protein K6T87_23660, partial [Roseiflexus sp.]|uniref:hypothetical protein n=1 Tax=Roseiflexus sp. TaxID=2562120 RepID=UPI0025DA816B